jgi:hypothetical protein
MTTDEIEMRVWDSIRQTINKFREQPYYFFTESDVASYLWMSLYSSKLQALTHDGRSVYLIHREYPTNFRYDKPLLLEMESPYSLAERKGTRGNFDLVVISPDFVKSAPSIEHIVNKNVRDLESRHDPVAEELLFAVEFKYVINSSIAWENEILRDNQKLLFAKRCNVKNVVNLVFCNTKPSYQQQFEDAVRRAAPGVCAVFIQSYYDAAGVKQTPVPIANTDDAGRKIRGLLAVSVPEDVEPVP